MKHYENLNEYIEAHSSPEGEYLYRLYRATNVEILNPHMASGHIQGRLLKLLVKMIRPKNILEIGTYTGYSAICMAEGLESDGKLYTFEIDDELEDFTRKWIEGSPVGDKIIFTIGSALEIVPTLNTKFDLVFIDGNKREYIEYYEDIMERKVNTKTVIAFRNIMKSVSKHRRKLDSMFRHTKAL